MIMSCTFNPFKTRYLARMTILFVISLLFVTGCSTQTETHYNKKIGERVENFSTHPSFVTRQELNAILANRVKPSAISEQKPEKIVSMVLPHHLAAGQLIINAIELLSQQHPKRIVLIGPNHFNQGGKMITGFNGWQTPGGVLQTDLPVVRFLIDKGLAVRDETVLDKEHSIGALVPILQIFLPDTKVVPIVLHYDVSLKEIDALLLALEPYLDGKTVVISSVDFSHYLTRSQAQAKDQETLKHMQNFDYLTLFALGNDYLDSPASLSASFRLAQSRGISRFTVLENTNSGILFRNDFMETTSYFTIIFTNPSYPTLTD